MRQARRTDHVHQRHQRFPVEVSDPLGFVRDYQCLLTDGVLSGYARGAMTGVARLRLNTAERKHEAARAVAPVSAHGDHTRHVKCADDFSAGTNANLNTQQTNTADLIAQSNEGTPVYVLESDITGTQNKVAMQNKLSVW